MSGNIESLRACEGYVNDHDNICDCRPVDVRAALEEIENLQAENQRLREELDTVRASESALLRLIGKIPLDNAEGGGSGR